MEEDISSDTSSSSKRRRIVASEENYKSGNDNHIYSKITHLQSSSRCNLVTEGYVISTKVVNKFEFKCASCTSKKSVLSNGGLQPTRWFEHLMSCFELGKNTKYALARFSRVKASVDFQY